MLCVCIKFTRDALGQNLNISFDNILIITFILCNFKNEKKKIILNFTILF